MSMYKGKVKFTKEQLIFLVDASISSAMDRIDSVYMTDSEIPETWNNSAMETCGMFIGILCAQLTGVGYGITDVLDSIFEGSDQTIREFFEDFIDKKRKNALTPIPDSRQIAAAWVNEMFRGYIDT